MTKIEYTLKEANRYDDVIEILDNIITTTNRMTTCPVNPYSRDGFISYKVNGKDVSEEAEKFLQLIKGDTTEGLNEKSFMNLGLYIKTNSDIQLHNFAVLASHRILRPDSEVVTELDTIRKWEILDNMLDNFKLYNFLDDYKIPDGWRKMESDLWDVKEY